MNTFDVEESSKKHANVNQIISILDTVEVDRILPENFPLTDETTCGIWIFKGGFLQKLANKNVYVFLYGIIGLVFSGTYAYFNGTISTLEKRYRISSQTSATISVGNDISQLFTSAILSYDAGKGNQPRWTAFGLGTIVIFCLMNIVPHFLYGPGGDALSLTVEYGDQLDANSTSEILDKEKRKTLCNPNAKWAASCDDDDDDADGHYTPQIILFAAQFISGIGQPLYYIGTSYMDNNIEKSKTPIFISLAYFMRMLGPACGYTLASLCLKLYISPSLTPTIDNMDPRWLGAWWLGWFIFAILMFIFALLIAMFPKTLPHAAIRRRNMQNGKHGRESEMTKASLKDMFVTFKRLLRNETFMLSNIASFFYIFGYMPYWTFTPKYIEIQYRQSASDSSLVTGAVALVFSAIGVLLSGFFISKYRPSARFMAAWNVVVGTLTVFGIISYIYLGCADNERAVSLNYYSHGDSNSLSACNSNCVCDYVKYSPVCGENGRTFISGCLAGCKEERIINGTKIYTNCSCVQRVIRPDDWNFSFGDVNEFLGGSDTTYYGNQSDYSTFGGSAIQGSCPVNCGKEFFAFLAVMCMLKFIGATSRSSSFLLSVRCVNDHDKTVAMGFSLMLLGFAFIPSPILFGMILDYACLVWGKTCSGSGNCWLYDGKVLRVTLNIISAVFLTIAILFDAGVWYFVKNLKIFDDDEQKTPNSSATHQNTIEMENLNTLSAQHLGTMSDFDQTSVSS